MPPHLLDDMLGALRRVSELLTGAGGKRYVADWLDDIDEDGWAAHFGPECAWWEEAKRRFDPDGVFRSLLLP